MIEANVEKVQPQERILCQILEVLTELAQTVDEIQKNFAEFIWKDSETSNSGAPGASLQPAPQVAPAPPVAAPAAHWDYEPTQPTQAVQIIKQAPELAPQQLSQSGRYVVVLAAGPKDRYFAMLKSNNLKSLSNLGYSFNPRNLGVACWMKTANEADIQQELVMFSQSGYSCRLFANQAEADSFAIANCARVEQKPKSNWKQQNNQKSNTWGRQW